MPESIGIVFTSIAKKEPAMIKTFIMRLNPGQTEEYARRHNELWPEMRDMIHEHGGHNCLDESANTLFGYIEIEDEELWAKSADTAINRERWDFMAPIPTTPPSARTSRS